VLDRMDKVMREHDMITRMLGNEINKKKLALITALDPTYADKWKKGYIDIGVDWKTQEIVVAPTLDDAKKAEEVSDALMQGKN